MDTSFSVVQIVCQGFFVIAVTALFLSWLAPKLKKLWSKSGPFQHNEVAEDDPEVLEHYRSQQVESRQRIQEQHNLKASDYKERILTPRETEKRQKKEEEFNRFLGPAWKGKGATLGRGDSDSSSDNENDKTLSEGRKAAQKRKVQEQINQKVAAAAVAASAAKQRPKRIITLPEEPEMNEEGVICVMLRTPIGTICQRRFYTSDKMQCLFDFITTQGFSQRKYTISTSYPRTLIEDPESCFSDYRFGKRVALNIEERD